MAWPVQFGPGNTGHRPELEWPTDELPATRANQRLIPCEGTDRVKGQLVASWRLHQAEESRGVIRRHGLLLHTGCRRVLDRQPRALDAWRALDRVVDCS